MDFYFIVGITAGGMEDRFITPSYGVTYERNKRRRTFASIVPAKVYLKKLRETTPNLKQGGTDFGLVHVAVNPDGTITTDWNE